MNKKGFISIAIVFSFLVVFLLLLSMILVTYSNNRVKLGLYKDTIKKDAYCLHCKDGDNSERCGICGGK